jgi:hypothetical protein
MHDDMTKVLELIYKTQNINSTQLEQINKLSYKSNIKITKNSFGRATVLRNIRGT